MNLLQSLFTSKKFLAMLSGVIGIVALKVFKVNIDAATTAEIVGLIAVYIGGQGIADANKEAAKIAAIANPDFSMSNKAKVDAIKSV